MLECWIIPTYECWITPTSWNVGLFQHGNVGLIFGMLECWIIPTCWTNFLHVGNVALIFQHVGNVALIFQHVGNVGLFRHVGMLDYSDKVES